MNYSSFVFAGTKPDLAFTLSDPSNIPTYAMRPSGSAFGQLCKYVKKIKSDVILAVGEYGLSSCSVLEELDIPNVQTLGENSLSLINTAESDTSPMATLNLPKIQTIESRAFKYRKQLQSVVLGSPGNPVDFINATAFENCTQYGLVINVYTTNGAALANSPWGATKATINYFEA